MSDEESEKQQQQQQQQPPVLPSVTTRCLNAFASPDLEVLVGPKQRIYRYHALILASYSTYVDTILSSPVAIKNQQEKRIHFPDISEETWELMIAFLEPGGFTVHEVSDMERVLPFYDKYQFVDGIAMCDTWIAKLMDFKTILQGYDHNNFVYSPDRLTSLAVMAFNLNFPKSKEIAMNWAAEVLKRMAPRKASNIKALLPLVENNDEILKALVFTTQGRHSMESMTIDEMRKLTQSDRFPKDLLLKTKQIDEVERIWSKVSLDMDSLYILGVAVDDDLHISGLADEDDLDFISGCYTKCYAEGRCGALRNRGAMQVYFKKNHPDGDVIIVIEAVDPFGLQWEIAETNENDDDDDDEEEATRRVLHRWDGGYSSLVPPQHGWKAIEGTSVFESLLYSETPFSGFGG